MQVEDERWGNPPHGIFLLNLQEIPTVASLPRNDNPFVGAASGRPACPHPTARWAATFPQGKAWGPTKKEVRMHLFFVIYFSGTLISAQSDTSHSPS